MTVMYHFVGQNVWLLVHVGLTESTMLRFTLAHKTWPFFCYLNFSIMKSIVILSISCEFYYICGTAFREKISTNNIEFPNIS